MQHLKMLVCCAVAVSVVTAANSQGFLKKIKEKADQAADKILEPKSDNSNNNANSNNADMSSGNQKGKPANKGGEGLIMTPPNVNDNLTAAETSFKTGAYGDTRYAVRQALLGVEMEIGKKILSGLPESISGMKEDSTSDEVTSSGWGNGWAGLTIKRNYNLDDKQLNFTISNNAAMMQAVNLYFANTGYTQAGNGNQNQKQTRVQNEKALIEYDASSGFKLSVPVGQTTLLVYEGVNFANEQDFMNAVNQINIASIKQQLGEK